MKTFTDFQRDMETDEELKTKISSALTGMDIKDEQTKIDFLTRIAAENGYNVSVEDFTGSLAGKQLLDEGELNLVSGGNERSCLAIYGCYAVLNICIYSNECYNGSTCERNIS